MRCDAPECRETLNKISDTIECTIWPSCVSDDCHSLPLGAFDAKLRPFPNTHELLERGKNNANPLFKTIHNQCFSPFAVVCQFWLHILVTRFSKKSGCLGCIRVSTIAGRISACADRSCCRGLWMHLGCNFKTDFLPRALVMLPHWSLVKEEIGVIAWLFFGWSSCAWWNLGGWRVHGFCLLWPPRWSSYGQQRSLLALMIRQWRRAGGGVCYCARAFGRWYALGGDMRYRMLPSSAVTSCGELKIWVPQELRLHCKVLLPLVLVPSDPFRELWSK